MTGRATPLRVGVDGSALAASPRTGVARALATHLEAWLAAKGAPDLVAFLPGETPFPVKGEVARWRLLHGPRPSRASLAEVRRRARALLRIEPVDVWWSPWSAIPDLDVPVVATVHELPFVRLGPVEGRLRTLAHRRWLARDVACAARIVVPSVATRDDLLALHPEAAPRLEVVPHGFDPAPWARAASAPAARRPYGVLLGARGPRKGADVWWGARRRLGDLLDWEVVGPPAGGLARPLAGDAGVRVHAALDDAALAGLLAGARVLVYPSRSEGFGFPPLEAMAAGVPVVAAAAGSIPEVVGDAALLVPPGDADALADAIRGVVTEPALSASLVERGRVRARAFPPAASAARLLAVLERAAAEGPR